MSNAPPGGRLPLFGGWARNLAAGAVFLGSLVCLIGAFLVSWSPGMSGEHKGDEGIRDVLVAVAVLALGLVFAVLFVGFFLLDIAVRVGKLERRAQPGPDDPKRGA
jgi:hypothetical protein